MIANYHTHTPRCRHAEGCEDAFVQAALNAGLEILGFSDHTPYWFPGEYYSHMRMFPNQLEEYCVAVRDMQKQYANQIRIHLGLEVEYYPACFGELLSRIRDLGVEYFLLGQHWLGNEMNEPYCGAATEDEGILKRYCNQVIEAIQTGSFSYIAHPDLINYVGDPKIYRQHIRRMCREANACGIPLEINLLGLGTGRNYPNQLLWEVAAEENCECVIGCDAHRPSAIGNQAVEDKALEIVKAYDLCLLDRIELRPVG